MVRKNYYYYFIKQYWLTVAIISNTPILYLFVQLLSLSICFLASAFQRLVVCSVSCLSLLIDSVPHIAVCVVARVSRTLNKYSTTIRSIFVRTGL